MPVERLCHYVAEHKTEWHEFLQPLTYAYNVQVHKKTGKTPFDLVLSWHPPGLQVEKSRTAIPDHEPENLSTAQVHRYILSRLRGALSSAMTRTTQAELQYKRDFDKTVRTFPKLCLGDKVYVDQPEWMSSAPEEQVDEYTRNYRRRVPKIHGPFSVVTASKDMVLINDDGIENRVRNERVTRVPR